MASERTETSLRLRLHHLNTGQMQYGLPSLPTSYMVAPPLTEVATLKIFCIYAHSALLV